MQQTGSLTPGPLGRLTDATARALLPEFDPPPSTPLAVCCWTVLACPRIDCGGLRARLAAAHAEHADARCPRCGAGALVRIAGPRVALALRRSFRPALGLRHFGM